MDGIGSTRFSVQQPLMLTDDHRYSLLLSAARVLDTSRGLPQEEMRRSSDPAPSRVPSQAPLASPAPLPRTFPGSWETTLPVPFGRTSEFWCSNNIHDLYSQDIADARRMEEAPAVCDERDDDLDDSEDRLIIDESSNSSQTEGYEELPEFSCGSSTSAMLAVPSGVDSVYHTSLASSSTSDDALSAPTVGINPEPTPSSLVVESPMWCCGVVESPMAEAHPAVPAPASPRQRPSPGLRLTPRQKTALLSHYKRDPYPKRQHKNAIADTLGLTSDEVHTWFQYTRNSVRRRFASLCLRSVYQGRHCSVSVDNPLSPLARRATAVPLRAERGRLPPQAPAQLAAIISRRALSSVVSGVIHGAEQQPVSFYTLPDLC